MKILIVDDSARNREAAKTFFDTQNDVEVDFAITYEEAVAMMKQKVYAFGLFDLNFPDATGGGPKPLGFKLAEEAHKQMMEWAVITAGKDHHGFSDTAFVCFCWNYYCGDKDPIEFDKVSETKMTELSKTSPKAWEKIFNAFLRMSGDHLAINVDSRERWFRQMGSMYDRGWPGKAF